MPRGNKSDANAMHARVLEAARANPEKSQREIASELGISRSMVTWYLSREHRLQLRRGAAKPRQPGRSRLPRTAQHVTMRAVAVRAIRAAFPHFTSADIADALGMDRQTVQSYLLGTVKSEIGRTPAWAPRLYAACAELAGDRKFAAIAQFEALARDLYAAVRTERES